MGKTNTSWLLSYQTQVMASKKPSLISVLYVMNSLFSVFEEPFPLFCICNSLNEMNVLPLSHSEN